MARLTIIFLTLISLSAWSCSAVRQSAATAPDERIWTADNRSDHDVNRYRINIALPRADLSGILAFRQSDDGTVAGTLINEFGVRAFDFISDANGTRLSNTVPMMDKWYIRRAIAADIGFILNCDDMAAKAKGVRTIRRNGDGSITMQNKRSKICYEISYMKQ